MERGTRLKMRFVMDQRAGSGADCEAGVSWDAVVGSVGSEDLERVLRRGGRQKHVPRV